MKSMIKGLLLTMFLTPLMAGCGPSKKDLAAMSDLLGQAQKVDCETLKGQLGALKTAIDEKLK